MRSILIIFLILLLSNACESRAQDALNKFFNSIDIGDTYESVSLEINKYCESKYARCFTYKEDEIKTLREHQRKKCNGDVQSVFVVTQLDQGHDIRDTDPIEFYRYIYIGSDLTVCDKEAFGLRG